MIAQSSVLHESEASLASRLASFDESVRTGSFSDSSLYSWAAGNPAVAAKYSAFLSTPGVKKIVDADNAARAKQAAATTAQGIAAMAANPATDAYRAAEAQYNNAINSPGLTNEQAQAAANAFNQATQTYNQAQSTSNQQSVATQLAAQNQFIADQQAKAAAAAAPSWEAVNNQLAVDNADYRLDMTTGATVPYTPPSRTTTNPTTPTTPTYDFFNTPSATNNTSSTLQTQTNDLLQQLLNSVNSNNTTTQTTGTPTTTTPNTPSPGLANPTTGIQGTIQSLLGTNDDETDRYKNSMYGYSSGLPTSNLFQNLLVMRG